MARAAGRATVFKIDDSGGTIRDISAHVTTVRGFLQEAAELEDTAMGDSWRSRITGGLKDVSFGIDGIWDDAATTGSDTVLSGIIGSIGTFNFLPDGTAPTYSGEVWLARYVIDSPVAGIVTFSADFRGDGTAVTRA